MDIPVTITTHSIEVDVTNEVVSVMVAVQTKTIQVTINYGLNATQVNAAIDAKLNKENVVGLKLTDSPEFADTQITPLATEATYTPAVWAYLVGLFTTVPKSVLQHIVKGWTVLQNLAERISVLENKTLFEITLEEDAIQIDIVGLSIKEGESFKLLIKGDSGYESTSLYVRVNDIISPNYQYSSTIYYYLLIPVGNERFSNDLTMALHGGRLVGSVIYSRSASGTTAGAVVALSTFDIHIDEITKISITRNAATIIKAGTYIKLLKL